MADHTSNISQSNVKPNKVVHNRSTAWKVQQWICRQSMLSKQRNCWCHRWLSLSSRSKQIRKDWWLRSCRRHICCSSSLRCGVKKRRVSKWLSLLTKRHSAHSLHSPSSCPKNKLNPKLRKRNSQSSPNKKLGINQPSFVNPKIKISSTFSQTRSSQEHSRPYPLKSQKPHKSLLWGRESWHLLPIPNRKDCRQQAFSKIPVRINSNVSIQDHEDKSA